MTRSRDLTEGKSIVQVVLPHAWIGRINRLALERGLNRSALIRAAIEATYFAKQPVVDTRAGGDAQEHERLEILESEKA